MAKYRLTADGPDRIEVRMSAFTGKVRVLVDGTEVATGKAADFEAQRMLDLGPDGAVELRWSKKENFVAFRDGLPLYGCGAHPVTAAHDVAGFLFVIAVLTLIGAIVMPLLEKDVTLAGQLIYGGIVGTIALIFGVCGILTRRGVIAAAWVAIVLYALDALTLLVSFSLPGLAVKVALLVGLIRGTIRMREARQKYPSLR